MATDGAPQQQQQQQQPPPPPMAIKAEDNVIIIKYKNVSSPDPLPPQVFQLKNEPLSVDVIESKFSQAIQLFDVSHNQISSLPKDLFCPLSDKVTRLNVSHNLLENFDCLGLISQAGQLCLSELKTLDMSHNLIKHLPATGVATLHNLEALDLSNNLIESLDELSLSSLLRLISLNLSHNKIQQLPVRVFHKSSSLRQIDLSYNNLLFVSELAFTNSQNNFTRIDLRHNELTGIRQEALRVRHQASSSGAAAAEHVAEFYLSSNPFVCDCQLEWMRKSQHQHQQLAIMSNSQYGRIADIDQVKCSPLFRHNAVVKQQRDKANHHQHHAHHHHLAHNHNHNHNNQQQQRNLDANSISLINAEPSNFLCRYKSHCLALCQCCEFDACDCEMICPHGCNCYYDSTWQTNIIDCSSNNHTVVPDRIPMDVSGLYLDGNNIDSLRPSNLIARKSLKSLYLNSTNLQFIANRTFNGLIGLEKLYLHDNLLRTLNGYEFEPLAQLGALYLQSNRLDHINNQTFIYLRSLKVLDLSNNRLTSVNLDLFMSIGHHNIRLRQISIAHNWWSCQCSSINRFRQILKQKFLLNGDVNIADKNQLRCYYNSTTVGPLILDGTATATYGGLQQQQQPIFATFPLIPSYASNANSRLQPQQPQQQQQLTEINQCSESIEDHPEVSDINPPVIHPQSSSDSPIITNDLPNDPYAPQSDQNQINGGPMDLFQQQQQQPQIPPINQPMFPPSGDFMSGNNFMPIAHQNPYDQSAPKGIQAPISSLALFSVVLFCILVVATGLFMFIRQQQQHYRRHKKSSAGSTTSVSSHNSKISSGRTSGHYHHHHHHAVATNQRLHHPQHHLIVGTNDSNQHHHSAASQQQMLASHHNHHLHLHHQQHSASSQNNIYAALVSPTNGTSTIVSHSTGGLFQGLHSANNSNNLYSNSSTTPSHHSTSSSSHQQVHGLAVPASGSASATTAIGSNCTTTTQHPWQQHQLYGPIHYGHLDNPYGNLNGNPSQASYKTGASLYNSAQGAAVAANCHESDSLTKGPLVGADWIRLPKVKQFVSKLVNKSLALGGYRAAASRDEQSTMASDKIYDAFLSYDKRDEPFVMQHLSAELEYGQPQYRIADRFRDLPLPNSDYIAEAITSVIGCSHRTIVILTEFYLSSDWCRYELEAAVRESALDRTHKIIAVVLDPKCLLELDQQMRTLLTNVPILSLASQQDQLVQLAEPTPPPPGGQQLVATLAGHQPPGGQQVSTQTHAQLATSRISFLNYNERKFWPKLKQLMPAARAANQTLTLTTKN